MITRQDLMKFAETWDSSKDPIIEDGKTLPQLFARSEFGQKMMWLARMEGATDQEIWEDALLS